jgi:hypothetical protein
MVMGGKGREEEKGWEGEIWRRVDFVNKDVGGDFGDDLDFKVERIEKETCDRTF